MASLKRQIFLILISTACIFSNEKDTCNFSLGDELDFNQISQINLSDFECLAANQENNLELFERLHKFCLATLITHLKIILNKIGLISIFLSNLSMKDMVLSMSKLSRITCKMACLWRT